MKNKCKIVCCPILLGTLTAALVLGLAFVVFLGRGCFPEFVRFLLKRLPDIVVALTAVVGAFLGIHTYRQQIKTDVFQKYTARYRKIMSAKALRPWRLKTKEPVDIKKSEALQIAALDYLNLCSEEFDSLRKGCLLKGIWKNWEGEIKRTLRTPLFIKAWETLRREFEQYEKFTEYVNKVQCGYRSQAETEQKSGGAVKPTSAA